ncbi:MAG TPA: hypothetical protein VD996_00490 [Chitinophagaceae bacterium]|nr:hypothetical protein [Chitinophagaceae bacterium]
MKRFLCLLVVVSFLQISHASALNHERPVQVVVKLKVPAALVLDACMDQYNAQTAVNNAWLDFMIDNFCYSVYQFPYNTGCHSNAIVSWSQYQDYLFEELVLCQNGNYGKQNPNTSQPK